MSGLRLSINTNPLVNRFAKPDHLVDTIANRIGAGYVQLTPEFINPSWPAATLRRLAREFDRALTQNRVRVTSIMTSTYFRLNHFGHPDPEVREYYVEWFKTLADVAVDIGAHSIGSQFAILTLQDDQDPARRADMVRTASDCWHRVADHAAAAGLGFLYWEPMSVSREFGHTIAECRAMDARMQAENFAIPMKMIVDIDHGDVTSDNPDDTDPYAWAAAFPKESPIIHVKQSSMNKGGHWPFTAEHNKDGRIRPEKLLQTVRDAGGVDNEICLELSFREREPHDSRVVEMMAESVAYWAPHIDTGRKG
jgi:D-erythrulose 1-phosphate 3-epimerase